MPQPQIRVNARPSESFPRLQASFGIFNPLSHLSLLLNFISVLQPPSATSINCPYENGMSLSLSNVSSPFTTAQDLILSLNPPLFSFPTPFPPPQHHEKQLTPSSPSSISQGPQFGKSAIDALPLPGAASRLSRHPRHLAHAAAQSHHQHRVDPDVREMARPGAQGDLAQGVQDPRPQPQRFPDPRPQRRDQQAHAREAHVGSPDPRPGRAELYARRG